MNLSKLESSFTEFVLSAAATAPSTELIQAMRPGGASIEERLAVYKNNVHARLTEALQAAFPAVERLVGKKFFRFAAREYSITHPPRSGGSLREYVREFAQFLRGFEPAGSVPYLADVARLELLYLHAYHAAEATPMTAAQVAKILSSNHAHAAPVLHPSAGLMQSPYPVSRIWELNRQPAQPNGKIRIDGGTEYLLVIRPLSTVEVRRLERGTYVTLVHLSKGYSLSSSIAAGSHADPNIDLRTQLVSLANGETFCLRGTDDEHSRQTGHTIE